MSIPMDLCSTEDHGHHLLVMRRLVNETILYALVTHGSRVRTVKAVADWSESELMMDETAPLPMETTMSLPDS